MSGGFCEVFAGAVGAAEAVGAYFPLGVAVVAAVVAKIILLEALGGAVGTDASFVQPVAVGV